MSKELTKNVANNVANTNSQHLTEQWREGTLPRGGYYIKLLDGSIKQTNYDNISKTFDTEFFRYNVSVKEVLAPVLSYPDLCELKQELEICKDEKADLYAKLCNALMQLEEANKVIKEFVKPEPICILCTEEAEKLPESNEIKVAKEYLERYGVK